MNTQYPQRPSVPNEKSVTSDEIDIISFDRRRRAEQIRQNEEAEREKRRRQQMLRRRQERIRRAKIERMKQLCMLGIVALGALLIVIGIITAIVKAVSGPANDNTITQPDNAVSAEETELITSFSANNGIFYSNEDNAFLNSADNMITDIVLSIENQAGIPALSNKINEYGDLSERYSLFSNSDSYSDFRNTVKNAPIFSNGYVWCETESMKSTITDGYMYDTNTSYIIAVANICLSEGSTDFLSETDTDAQPRRDSSKGMTVGDKLQKAVNYFFDNDTVNGGIKFDTISSLCYIHTEDNNGTKSGKPSNKWFNFRFGYLDAYSNISFNKAMTSLAKLYTLAGVPEQADKYSSIAEQHKAAFNEKFWDSVKQRYVGCFDKDGNVYDYGFVFLNLEAIEAGIADSEKASAILSWIDGERIIEDDTSKGTDIYAYSYAPRNTTVAAVDKWWDYLGGTLPLSAEGGFNKYWQNGGVSLSTAYYDIMSRYTAGNTDKLTAKLTNLVDGYNSNKFAESGNAVYGNAGNATSGIAPVAVLKTVFSLYSDGHHLNITPNLGIIPKTVVDGKVAELPQTYGISGIGYAKNTYNFLFDEEKVFITAVSRKPVRINIGGFEAGAEYDLVFVDSGIEISRIPSTANSNGVVAISAEFGSTCYVRIEKTKAEKTDK